jgi:hypothetical protein
MVCINYKLLLYKMHYIHNILSFNRYKEDKYNLNWIQVKYAMHAYIRMKIKAQNITIQLIYAEIMIQYDAYENYNA